MKGCSTHLCMRDIGSGIILEIIYVKHIFLPIMRQIIGNFEQQPAVAITV